MVVRHIKKKRNIGNVYSYDERFWIAGQNYKFDEVLFDWTALDRNILIKECLGKI